MVSARFWCGIAGLTVCLAQASVADAQTGSVSVPDLLTHPEQLAEWIASHSQEAAAAAARVEQARAAYETSRLRPNPQLTAGLAGIPVGPTNPPGLGLGQTLNYGASISELFEIGKRAPRRAGAQLRLESERYALADTVLGSLAAAREALARVLYGKSRLTTLDEQVALARQMLELQRIRFERGDLSGVDFDRVQLDLEMLSADRAQADADYRDSLATCERVLFASCDPGEAGLDTVVALVQPPEATLPANWDAHLDDRPDIKALVTQQQAAVQDAELALKRTVPDPVVSVGFTRDYFAISGNNPRVLAAAVTIPLPTFDRGKQDAARAEAARAELRANEATLRAHAHSDAHALQERQRALLTTIDDLRTTALARAAAILASTSDAVNQGELSTTDLLLARRAETDVTLRIMDLQLELFITQNALRQVVGVDAPIASNLEGAQWPTP